MSGTLGNLAVYSLAYQGASDDIYKQLPAIVGRYGWAGGVRWLRGQLYDLATEHYSQIEHLRVERNKTAAGGGVPRLDYTAWRAAQEVAP